MDILTVELFGVTASQALRELSELLDREPSAALRVEGDDGTVLHNVQRLLERRFRPFRVVHSDVRSWRLELEAKTLPIPAEAPPAPPPVLLLRGAFAPGDRALGRRLLLGTLASVKTGTPWVCLAHEALDLLEDPAALEILAELESRGVAVRVSAGSRAWLQAAPRFASLDDAVWQGLLAAGAVTVL